MKNPYAVHAASECVYLLWAVFLLIAARSHPEYTPQLHKVSVWCEETMESSTSSLSDTFPEGRCRLILIGKTGAGKSATGNTIVGAELFKSTTGLNAETKQCGLAIGVRNGLEILVMDTPGLCDTDGEDDLIAERITQSLFAVAPGPHAILLVIRADNRFTAEEMKAIQMLKDIFGPSMTSYLIPVFVRKDQLEGTDFQEQLERSKAKSVIEEANNRYILFDNRACTEEKAHQVEQLLLLVRQVVRQTNGHYYRHKISCQLDQVMSEMVREELRKRGTESMLEIQGERVGKEIGILKETTEARNATSVALSANEPLYVKEGERHRQTEEIEENKMNLAEEQKEETAENEMNLTEQEVRMRKKEMMNLKLQGTVRNKVGIFDSPPASPQGMHRSSAYTQFRKRASGGSVEKEEPSSQRFPSPRSSLEHKPSLDGPDQISSNEASHGQHKQKFPTSPIESEDSKPDSASLETLKTSSGGNSGDGSKTTSLKEPHDSEESSADVAVSENPRQKTADTGAGDIKEDPTDTESMDIVWDWSLDQSKLEAVLDQLEEDLKKELITRHDSLFFYEIPDKSAMSMGAKRMLVEDALRKKIISHPEKLNDMQKKQMGVVVKSVSQKFKEGMNKFAVKQCRLM